MEREIVPNFFCSEILRHSKLESVSNPEVCDATGVESCATVRQQKTRIIFPLLYYKP